MKYKAWTSARTSPVECVYLENTLLNFCKIQSDNTHLGFRGCRVKEVSGCDAYMLLNGGVENA
jgi:hypothetical protein